MRSFYETLTKYVLYCFTRKKELCRIDFFQKDFIYISLCVEWVNFYLDFNSILTWRCYSDIPKKKLNNWKIFFLDWYDFFFKLYYYFFLIFFLFLQTSLSSTGDVLTLANFLAMASSFIAASFITFLVQEKTSKVKLIYIFFSITCTI